MGGFWELEDQPALEAVTVHTLDLLPLGLASVIQNLEPVLKKQGWDWA